ncbi:MAG TPA: kinase/pyrophosphorylase [Clostridia bacterium]|nr:kinase/pyrophosphorylase [Clostridia bacterium]
MKVLIKEGRHITHTNERAVVYVVSDALGETAEFVVRAAASQFNQAEIDIVRVPYVTDRQHLRDIMEEAAQYKSVFAYTLVVDELRDEIITAGKEFNIPIIDILGPVLEAISRVAGKEPVMKAGLLRRLDEEYFRKVEAVEFAVKYDDGKDPRGLMHADIVLIGVSRTSKTPVSMYLAHKRLKTANVPLVPEVAPPEELFQIPVRKIVGLTIDPGLLNEIRQERLKALGLTADADYANMKRILRELEYAEEVMKKIGCPVIDVTNRAIEETASKVLEIHYKGERHGK